MGEKQRRRTPAADALIEKGRQVYGVALAARYPKADALAEDISPADIRAAHRVMVALRQKLEGKNHAEEQA